MEIKNKIINMNNTTIMVFILILFINNTYAYGDIIDINDIDSSIDDDCNNLYDPIVKLINDNENNLVHKISHNYNKVGITIKDENMTLVLDFKENKLGSIYNYDNVNDLDLNVSFDRVDINYLFYNWNNMSIVDKIRFMIKSDMPINDVMTLGAIIVGETK